VSLRARLLIGMVAVALVLVAAAAIVTRITRANLVDQIDAQLQVAGVRVGDGPGAPGPGEGGQRLSTLYVGFLSAGGVLTTVAAPDLAGDEAPTPRLDDTAVEDLRSGHVITVPSDDRDVDYRIMARPERRTGGSPVLALPLNGVDETVRRLIAVEAIAVLAALAVLGLVTWWVIRLGVQPVRRMTATARAIAAGDLSARVPTEAVGTEAGELGQALNGMLGRIEDAFDERAASESRLRQFVADASHELRTPVATIRGYAELYRAGGLADPGSLDDAMRRTEQETLRMGGLVDDLLHLARLDQGRPLEREPLDLTQLAERVVGDARAVDPERDVRVEPAGAVVVMGDGARLHQVVSNLVGNAMVHAPGATIEVRVTEGDGVAVLEVIDDGPGMAEHDATHAFERFYRADASRGRHQGGSGLGLAIVEATVRAHGGTASITSREGAGTSVRVELPLAPAAPPVRTS
jgi:two-component system, OmpR family, sensor kinase